MEKEVKSVWLRALEIIKKEVNAQVFQTWFQPIKMISCEENLIGLRAPNKFIKDWVLEHYGGLIKGALEKTAHKDLKISFFVEENNGGRDVAQKKGAGDPCAGLNPKYSFPERIH